MTPWLSVVGIGLDGLAGLSEQAREALSQATIVAGSHRQLDGAQIDADRRYVWPTPLRDGIRHIVQLRGQGVAVLASGDPMHFGIGATLSEWVPVTEMAVYPAPSAFSLAAARLGWPLQDVSCQSLHGRPLETLHAMLRPGLRLLLLTRDGDAPSEILSLLLQAGYGESRVFILENLGGADEAIHEMRAEEHSFDSYAALNTLAIECVADPDVQVLPALPGLPDGAFLHDGQLTKRDVRAATLAALQPLADRRLWDVGAGCGSIAIEWLRSQGRGAAVAFERDAERIDMIQQNALRLGVPHLAVVAGAVPETLDGQAPPDAVFLGGAVSDDRVFEQCWQVLTSGGPFVANAVTLEGEAALARRHRELGGELVRIEVSRSVSVGAFRAMQPGMAVTQWRVVKP